MTFTNPSVGKSFGFTEGRFNTVQFRTIVRVGKRSFTDNKGDLWSLDGKKYGTGEWSHIYAQDDTPELRQQATRADEKRAIEQKINVLAGKNWRWFPDDSINAIYELVEREVRRKKEANHDR